MANIKTHDDRERVGPHLLAWIGFKFAGIKAPAPEMDGAADRSGPGFEFAVAHQPALVRAGVVYGVEVFAVTEHRDELIAGFDGDRSVVRDLVDSTDDVVLHDSGAPKKYRRVDRRKFTKTKCISIFRLA